MTIARPSLRFYVSATMPSGRQITSVLKKVADVDVLQRTLTAKGAKDITVAEGVDGEVIVYEAWRSQRSESLAKGLFG